MSTTTLAIIIAVSAIMIVVIAALIIRNALKANTTDVIADVVIPETPAEHIMEVTSTDSQPTEETAQSVITTIDLGGTSVSTTPEIAEQIKPSKKKKSVKELKKAADKKKASIKKPAEKKTTKKSTAAKKTTSTPRKAVKKSK